MNSTISKTEVAAGRRVVLEAEDIAALAREYDGSSERIDTLMAKYGLRRHQVIRFAKEGGYRRSRPRITWTTTKVAYLKANFGRRPIEEICAHLQCTPAAIQNQKKRLGLSTWAISAELGYNIREIESLTKIDHRAWMDFVDAGELKAVTLSAFDSDRVTRVISVESLHAFLRQRPEFLDASKMDLSARAALELFNLPEPPKFKRVICRSAANQREVMNACTAGPYHHGELTHRQVAVRRAAVSCADSPFSFWAPIFETYPICPRCGCHVTRFSEERVYLNHDPGDDEVMKIIASKINLAYIDGKIVDPAGNEVSEQEMLAYAFNSQRNPKVAFRVFSRLIERGLTPAVKRPADRSTWRPTSLMDYGLTQRQNAEMIRLQAESNICVTWPPGEGKMYFLAYLMGLVPGRHALFVNTQTLGEQWARFFETHCAGAVRVRRSNKPSHIKVRLYSESGTEHAQIDIWGYQTRHDFPDEKYTIIGYDEAHFLPGTLAHRVALLPSVMRVGLTATPYREDGRASLIGLLTGDAGNETWADILEDRPRKRAQIEVCIADDLDGKFEAALKAIPKTGRGLVFVEAIQDGKTLSERTGAPFVYSEVKNRLDVIRDNRVVICSRVADHGLDIVDLEWVIEFGFFKGSRSQELQRYGRLLHSRTALRYTLLMTRKELSLYSKRLTALEDQGLSFSLNLLRKDAKPAEVAESD
ncbi:MAG: hypothetical protein E6R08_10230 [Nevskiaceae bacterium]|nr:MAG: hypothetical protein E6R08_10230 [Nevskiaceae bacterium]